MSVFNIYARYYDLLYRDKDYPGEVEYIDGLIRRNRPDAKSILDLGCGTGRHDFLMAEKGYSVTGIDSSNEMISIACSRTLPSNQLENLHFKTGDIRSARLGKCFDVVVSLFHVMSYQTGEEDLAMSFQTAREHLGPGGIFIFDCWYGPAVLTERPATRVKRLQDANVAITRIAESELYPNESIVDVDYHIFIRDKKNNQIEEITETHRMRYWFKPEIKGILRSCGFILIDGREWMTEKMLGLDTWSACFVARRI